MICASVADIKKAYEESPANARRIAEEVPGMSAHNFKEDAVTQWLNGAKTAHLAHNLGKGVRPWSIVNLTAKLDEGQPWIGVEYETGYKTKAQYEAVVNYVWNNFAFSTIDREGCSFYPCEITFPPVNMNDFMGTDYGMDKLLSWSQKNAPKASHNHKQNAVGTHINISTPAFRDATSGEKSEVVNGINILLRKLAPKENDEFFGRQPYGRAYHQGFGKNAWIEFKLFDSTGDYMVWTKYKSVAAKLAELVEYMSSNPDTIPASMYDGSGQKAIARYSKDHLKQSYVYIPSGGNLADFLRGEIPAEKVKVKYERKKNDAF